MSLAIESEIESSSTVQSARKIAQEAQPKFDTLIRVDVLYHEGGRWNTVDMSCREYQQILQTGLLDDRQVCAITVNEINTENDDEDKVRLIYDFILKHTNQDPWRLA